MKNTILALMIYTFSLGTQASLITDIAGNLIGASNIEISGSLFDVSFIDGSCIEIYSGCNSNSNFMFSSQSSATAASRALIEQVFINTIDSVPSKTNGCEAAITCWAYTPYNVNSLGHVLFQAAINGIEEYHDSVGCCSTNDYIDLKDWETATWAVWSVTTSDDDTTPSSGDPIPEPSFIFVIGLGLMAILRWQSNHSSPAYNSHK